MPAIEGWCGEIVVVGMNIETLKGIDRRFRPLPYIPDHIVELSMGKFVYGTAGGPIVQMDIGGGRFRVRDFRNPATS